MVKRVAEGDIYQHGPLQYKGSRCIEATFFPARVQLLWHPRSASRALPLGKGPVAASLRGGKQRRRRAGQVGKPPPVQPRGGWGNISEGGKGETEARRLANEFAQHPPQCRAPGAYEPRAIPRRSPGPGIRGIAPLRSPREKRSRSLRRLRRKPRRSRTRTRALAPSPLRPPLAPLRPGSGPPRPCPSASARTNPVAWQAQRWSRGRTSQSPNCPRQAPGSDVPRGSVATEQSGCEAGTKG
ncbi:hypothetical protein NN561_016722 [Cricetulus griseus]